MEASQKEQMEADVQGRLALTFRRNFRVPYHMYTEKILGMATARFWPNWDLVKHDASHRPICDLELKLLGALFILANGSTFFTAIELTYMSEEVVRSFF